MGTVEIIILVLTLLKEFTPIIKTLIEKGSLDPQKGPEAFIGILEGILPVAGDFVVKNNPEWEKVVELVKPLLESYFTSIKE